MSASGHIDTLYLGIIKDILDNGTLKGNRTGIRAITLPFLNIRYDMANGFPILTTKKMGIKNIATELEGFIQGITSKKWYQDRDCHIWDEWANPEQVRKRLMKRHGYKLHDDVEWKATQAEEDDLGPIYGYQWRNFNYCYDEDDGGTLTSYDQLKSIVDTLHKNPNDRRMVCSAWNPQQMDMMALPPCHVLWNVVVVEDTIHLGWHQRSCDSGYGIPYNIASYGLLLELLAKESGLKPGILHATFADCHIYENQVDGLREQLTREPKPAPSLSIDNWDGIFNWKATDIRLNNYESWPKLSLGEIAV